MNKIVFADFFKESKGKPFIYNGKEIKMSEKISLHSDKVSLLVEFISTKSEWKQGIVLETKGVFEFVDDGEKISNGIVLWEHTAPKQVKLTVASKDKTLFVYNVWEVTDHLGNKVMHYGYGGGALFIEKIDEATAIYHCNDGHADDDFNDLVFSIKIEHFFDTNL